MRVLGINIRALVAAAIVATSAPALAGPVVGPGDLVLRHDIQRLADAGIVTGPTTTWPLAWGPILDEIRGADALMLPAATAAALARVQRRASWETRTSALTYNAEFAVAEKAAPMRSFQDSPRGRVEASAGVGWIGDRIAMDLNFQAVDSLQDDQELRLDGSMVGAVIGNYAVAASTMQRWWGPGWDGSLILSNNARPMPALTIDRVFTDAFASRWLRWLGPWDVSVIFGQMEKERQVPNTRYFAMRFNFRPLPSLEIGLSRAAQWCGDGRPCDFDTFVDLLAGKDNVGDAGIGSQNEPGNQLAGLDFRWSPTFFDWPFSVYGQFIGEDEAGGFPSRYLAQAGIDGAGFMRDKWSYRWFAELAGTSCDFLTSDLFNCAYNHGIYQTGYRYRGRTIGHAADNDALLVSAGWIMVDNDDRRWIALVRVGELNRGGPADANNTLASTPRDMASIDLTHSRVFSFGVIEASIGWQKVDDALSGTSQNDGRAYLQWRSSY